MKTFLLGRHGEGAARVQGKATIRDVARRAGVSIATVSRYLNRSGPVDEATGLRIARAVEETRHAPSMAASSLKTQRAHMVLLVVPDVCNPFYSAMAREVQRLTGARGYAMYFSCRVMRASATATQVNSNPYDSYTVIRLILVLDSLPVSRNTL